MESKSTALVAAVFGDFPKNKSNFLHKSTERPIPHRAAPYEEFFSRGSRHHCPTEVGSAHALLELTEVFDDTAGGFLLFVAGGNDGVCCGGAQCRRHLFVCCKALLHGRVTSNEFVVLTLQVHSGRTVHVNVVCALRLGRRNGCLSTQSS